MNFNSMDMYFQSPNVPEMALKIGGGRKYDTNEDQTNQLTRYEINKHIYQNIRGINTPSSYLLLLDSKTVTGGTANNFVYNQIVFDLCDPIIIDSPTDIFLEYIHFQNIDIGTSTGTEMTSHLEGSAQFYIQIEEFGIKHISNNHYQANKFFVPNLSYGSTDDAYNDADSDVKTYHTVPKSNFLCDIEANYIRRLTVTITADYGTGTDHYYLTNRNTTSISNQVELVAWATDGNNVGALTSNITLSGGTWPLALNNNKTLEGKNFTITMHSGMTEGLFVLSVDGRSTTVQNLILDADAITTFDNKYGVLFSYTPKNNLSYTVTNCGVIGTYNLGTNGGAILGYQWDTGSSSIQITSCFSTATIAGVGSGGIVGSHTNRGGSCRIHNCFSTGNITGEGAGGIAGRGFGYGEPTAGEAIITNCYSLGDITHTDAGGIVGKLCGANANSIVLIGNCYSFGDIIDGGGGIVGLGAYCGDLTLENCHSVHATGIGVSDNQLIKSNSESASNAPTITDCSAGSGTWTPNLGTILKDNYTDSESQLADTDVWLTSGSFSSGYGLTVFATSPWNSDVYTSHSTLPTFGTPAASSSSGAVTVKNNGKITIKLAGKLTVK